jgi:hypothetical protein
MGSCFRRNDTDVLAATNAKRLRKEAKATKQSILRIRDAETWIASLGLAMTPK